MLGVKMLLACGITQGGSETFWGAEASALGHLHWLSSTWITLPPEHPRSGCFSLCRFQLKCHLPVSNGFLCYPVLADLPSPSHFISFPHFVLLLTLYCNPKWSCSFSFLLAISPTRPQTPGQQESCLSCAWLCVPRVAHSRCSINSCWVTMLRNGWACSKATDWPQPFIGLFTRGSWEAGWESAGYGAENSATSSAHI